MHPADKFEAEYYEKHGHYPSIREVWDAAQPKAKQEPAQELTAGKVYDYLEQQCEIFGFNPRAVTITLEDEGIRLKKSKEPAQAVEALKSAILEGE